MEKRRLDLEERVCFVRDWLRMRTCCVVSAKLCTKVLIQMSRIEKEDREKSEKKEKATQSFLICDALTNLGSRKEKAWIFFFFFFLAQSPLCAIGCLFFLSLLPRASSQSTHHATSMPLRYGTLSKAGRRIRLPLRLAMSVLGSCKFMKCLMYGMKGSRRPRSEIKRAFRREWN